MVTPGKVTVPADTVVTIRPPSKPILIITTEGKLLRDGVLVEDLAKAELVALVHELVQLVRGG